MAAREKRLPSTELEQLATMHAHAERIVRESRLNQGLPERITDPGSLIEPQAPMFGPDPAAPTTGANNG